MHRCSLPRDDALFTGRSTLVGLTQTSIDPAEIAFSDCVYHPQPFSSREHIILSLNPYSGMTSTASSSKEALTKITNVRLPLKSASAFWDVSIKDGRITSIDPHNPKSSTVGILDGEQCLLAPSLCHAHIHLDKCFLLQDPKFSDLQIEKGDFQEAMEMTGKAKSRFEEDDLLRRGRQLIEESIQHGVTAMRAFVEVDEGVGFKCLDAGLKLKEEFHERCEVQICAFAQLPLFSGEDEGKEIRRLFTAAVARGGVDVLGSTPYVEQDQEKSKSNVKWLSELALEHGKHLDLHLDYFIEEEKPALIFDALDILRKGTWPESGKQIALGHCVRTFQINHCYSPSLWSPLSEAPVHLKLSYSESHYLPSLPALSPNTKLPH